MSGGTVTFKVHLGRGPESRLELREGEAPAKTPVPEGRVPRVARLMALAIRLEHLVRSGRMKDYAQIARAGHLTRARVSQIIALLNLAPDIQEQILFLPRVVKGRDPVGERDLRPIAAELDWQLQRRMWESFPTENLPR